MAVSRKSRITSQRCALRAVSMETAWYAVEIRDGTHRMSSAVVSELVYRCEGWWLDLYKKPFQ